MRIRTLAVIGLMGFGLSGCSLWTKSDKAAPAAHSETTLRPTSQQTYQFEEEIYAGNVHNSAPTYTNYANSNYSKYAGYVVELFDTGSSYVTPAFTDPRRTEFVMLNGESQAADWQNCETRNRGYLFMSEYDFMLDPRFEVCMRNKGYVMTSEYNPGTKQVLSAQTAGLRGSFPQTTYSQSAYPQSTISSAYYP